MPERYYRELLNFFSGMAHSRELAADLVQEGYVRFFMLQRNGQAISHPRALLYRLIKNIQVDQLRQQSVRGELAASMREWRAADVEAIRAPLLDEPETALCSRRAVLAISDAIEALPPRRKEAFVLHKIEGLSQSEVADRMGISRKMVEQHVHLALSACRCCKDQSG